MANEPTYDFAINGLNLTPNATRIQLHKRNINSYGHVLRQSAPVAHRSGRSNFVISVELAFPNHKEINEKLRHLIAHFKVSPFAQLDSKYASRAAFPSEAEAATFAATLSNLSIYTVPNAPESLFANLDLTIFNYFPYSPDFSFKTETTAEGATKKTYKKVGEIHKSNIYKKAFDNIIKNIPKITTRTNHKTEIIYNKYVKELPPTTGEIKEKDISNIGKTLFFADTDDVVFEGKSAKMHREAVGNFKQIARVYRKRTGKRLPVSNMFMSALDIDFYYDETEKDILDDHRAGVAFDVAMYSRSLDGVEALKYLYLGDKDYKILVEIANDYGFIANKDKPWHFSLSSTSKSIQEIVRDNHTISSVYKGSKKNILDYGDYIKVYHDFLQEKKSQGLFPTNVGNIWKKEVVETIDEHSRSVAVTSINVSLTHDITSIPILGYEYPTTQYLGGKHSKAILALEGLRHDQIDKIKLGLNTTNNNENDFKRARDHNILTIANPILSLVGLRHCVVDSTESSTVPGSPDMDIFVFSATQHDPWFKETLSQEQISGSKAAKTSVFKAIKKHLNQYKPLGEVSDIPTIGGALLYAVGIKDDADKMGVTSTYNSGSPNHSALLSSYIDRVADTLNKYIKNNKIHKDYNVDSLYSLGTLVQNATSVRPYPQKTVAENILTGDQYTYIEGQVDDKSIDLDLISDLYSDLSNIFWDMLGDGILDLDDFKAAKKEFDRFKKQSLTQCYPDMNLPATTTDDPIDTDPDYFFWNEDKNGTYLKEVTKDVKEYAKDTLPIAQEMEQAAQEGVFTFTDVDSKSGAKNGHERPKTFNDTSKYFEINDTIKKSHEFTQNGLESMLDELVAQSVDDDVFTMNRAHPTYKIYFIEEDEDEEFSLVPNRSFDDYFGYNAVHDIKIVRSRKVPADLCIISMSNLSGNLTNRAKYNADDLSKFYETRRATKETVLENPLDALMLRPGQRIQVRLGYSNSPDNLEIVFNGQVVEVGGTHNVTIVCQSFATELVQQIKGIETPEALTKPKDKITSGILANLMQSPEVVHFGSRKKGIISNTLFRNYKEISSAGNTLYGPNLDPRDDNIFAPDIGTYLKVSSLLDPGGANWDISLSGAVKGALTNLWDATLATSAVVALTGGAAAPIVPAALAAAAAFGLKEGGIKRYTNLDYKLFHTTIWDVFKEMELRHPGWIASPVPYGNRMTMFFGVPDMGYWSRPETHDEYMKNQQVRNKLLGETPTDRVVEVMRYGAFQKHDQFKKRRSAQEGPLADENYGIRVALTKGRFKPFRNHHYLGDKINIVSNDIRVNSDVYNAVTVQYVDDVTEDIDEYGNVNYDIGDTKTFKVHSGLRDEHVNLLFSPQPNCEGKWMSARYAQGLLLRHMRDVYTGSITILGSPSIKPYDVCHIFDDITEMYGPIEVEQVVHHFSKETGFITEIIPDLIVSGNQYATLTLTQAMGQIHWARDFAIGMLIWKGASTGRSFGATLAKGVVAERTGQAAAAVLKAGAAIKTTGSTLLASGKNAIGSVKTAGIKTAANNAILSTKESLPKILDKLSNPRKVALRKGFKNIISIGFRLGGKRGLAAAASATLFGIGTYYVTKTQEHQPIFIHPLIVNRVPFISGMEGIRSGTLYSAWLERFGRGVDDVGDLVDDISEAIQDIIGEIL